MDFLNHLRALIGYNYVLTDTSAQPFLLDWRGRYKGCALAVVFPKNVQEISKIVCLCIQYNVSVVPQGGNTGLCGGSIPNDGLVNSIVLSTTRLNAIKSIDTVNDSIVVEAGCTLKKLQDIALQNNRFFPLSLASEGSCTIGGNLATNAGGTQVIRYGNMRDLTLGIEFVNPHGLIINSLKSLRKDNSGYSLRDLYIGSEGTLGIITAASLKLFPIENRKITALVSLDSIEDAVCLLERSRCVFGCALVAFELISNFCLNLSINFIGVHGHTIDKEFSKSPWFILLELSDINVNDDEDFIMSRFESFLGKCIDSFLIKDAVIGVDRSHSNSLWHIRESIPLAEKSLGKAIKHDISLPISCIPKFLNDIKVSLHEKFYGLQIVVFGHLGDGNLHFNLFKSCDQTEEELLSLQDIIYDLVHSRVNDLGGSISAEHGIGQLKVLEIIKYKNEGELDMMKSIKNALDPYKIMNPGKIIQY
ncbi:FAD/FMN-containing dehydrogenase [Candidatus Kinetoplastibacterium desouzaii TCC079E]|uniref:FAD/FMN-containing dehydrogenase n=1 Tax=Candidatus Kinetoplastidibacterium desouzai TCC079E TaxID=1208919 RepID=M1LLM5_9PROT|nr:FAD-binding oxidoreductase [Candidatus Kinetoplastibacterium desouzaii]AGF46652.1 FAD/FMN-containing dehydrogenase [Candidatus Kinetoplastibacterium desouzaii TCC079E]